MQDDTWKKIYDSYPINQEMIWLNNCGTTSPSLKVVSEVTRFLNGYSRSNILTSVKSYEQTGLHIKTMLSELLHCSPSELALIHNTSEGMNLVSWGLRLQQGDTILLLENEYPSNVYPWQHWMQKGVEIQFVPVGNSPAEFLENFNLFVHERVKVVSISSVHWCTGMPLPVKEVGDICEKNSISLILDGAQGVGHIDIHLDKMNILTMAFSAWKWLLGPLGLGVLYVNQNRIDEIDYVFKGQNSVTDGDNYLPYKNTLKEGAARYEYSTPAFLDWVYFESALELLHETGFERAQARIIELSTRLKNGLAASGYRLLSENFGEALSGIVVFDSPHLSSEEIYEELRKNKVIGALRLNRIRLSPHVYNSFEQLDFVLSVLNNLART